MESSCGQKGLAKFPKTNVNIKADKATYIRTTNKPTDAQVIIISKPTSNCHKFERKYSNSSGPPYLTVTWVLRRKGRNFSGDLSREVSDEQSVCLISKKGKAVKEN
jgi:hypothetical protein